MNGKIWIPIAIVCAGLWFTYVGRSDSTSDGTSTSEARSDRTKERRPSAVEPRRMTAKRPEYESIPKAGSVARAINAVEDCYRTLSCPFPQNDPRAYEYAVGQRLRWLLKEQLRRSRSSPSPYPEMTDVAISAIRNPDAHVQDVALDILATLPPSRERLQALLEGLTDNPDPKLMEKGVRELARYVGTEWEIEAQDFVAATIANGPHFSAQTLSVHALIFINSTSYEMYRHALEAMPPESQAAANLSAALEEYRRMRTGA